MSPEKITPFNPDQLNEREEESEAQNNKLLEVSMNFAGIIDEGIRKGDLAYDLSFGSKEARVYIASIYDYLRADSFVKNLEGAERLPDETSVIYSKINELLQDLSDANEKMLHYHFKTQYPQLAKWALTKGYKIFHWNRSSSFKELPEEKMLDESNEFTALKIYKPQEKENS